MVSAYLSPSLDLFFQLPCTQQQVTMTSTCLNVVGCTPYLYPSTQQLNSTLSSTVSTLPTLLLERTTFWTSLDCSDFRNCYITPTCIRFTRPDISTLIRPWIAFCSHTSPNSSPMASLSRYNSSSRIAYQSQNDSSTKGSNWHTPFSPTQSKKSARSLLLPSHLLTCSSPAHPDVDVEFTTHMKEQVLNS